MSELFFRWSVPFVLAVQSICAWFGDPPTRLEMCLIAALGAAGWFFLGMDDAAEKKEKP